MNSSNGILDLLGRRMTLERRIEAHLMRARTDLELKDDYVDSADRQNVRYRALISAVLDACFEHGFPDGAADIVEVEVARELNIWSELANARRSFLHDVAHLNNGGNAQGCLSPVATDSIMPNNTMEAKRKLLIVWLAVIELWAKNSDFHLFRTRSSVRAAAAEATGTTSGSVKTHRSNMKNGKRFSENEREFYQNLIATATAGGRPQGEEHSAFQILLPAARGLSAAAQPEKISAEKLKG